MPRRSLGLILFIVCILGGRFSFGQSCPANIGFENGTFSGWATLSGTINATGGINMTPGAPDAAVHTIVKNASPQARDPYGNFPVNCPNGSGYSVKLGNGLARGRASSVAYTFTIPADQNDYSIIYNYAVVLQNPLHQQWEQPKLTSRVFDVAANKYLECGSFEFVAAANLPGFRESSVEPNIFYKDWAPVTIKLAGLAGKVIRLEFTVNDCTQQVHFGYAYIDVDENCSTPVTGNTYCNGSGPVVLKAPYGFKEYKWFDSQSTLVSTNNTLRLDPPPPNNTKYRLEIVPFPNQGCYDTLETTIIASSDFMKLQVPDTLGACASTGVNLTAASVTAGSSSGLGFEYYTDSTQREFLSDPAFVTKTGAYYIKATAPSGCTEIKPVHIVIQKPLQLTVHPQTFCSAVVDLTAASVTAGSEAGLSYTYWRDTTATSSLQNPDAITVSGKYFIKATNTEGCTSVKPVTVTISNAPVIVLKDIHSCGQLVFSSVNPSVGSDPTVQFSYWSDAAATIGISSTQVFSSGSSTVYAKATTTSGCTLIRPFQVSVHSFPVFTITDPPLTARPATVDLSTTVPATGNWGYTYWRDELASKILAEPDVIILSGTYYIKATDAYGCSTVKPVTVTIIDPPVIPPNIFSPNNDGINDTWLIPILSSYANCMVEIFGRDGRSVFRSSGYSQPWDARYKGKLLPPGTYYYLIKLTPDKTPISGSVTIVR